MTQEKKNRPGSKAKKSPEVPENIDLSSASNRKELSKLFHDTAMELWEEDGQWDEAYFEFKQAVEYDSDNIDALADFADFLLESEEFDETLDLVEKGLQLAPEDSRFCTLKGNVYRCRGDYKLSLRQYDLAIELNPKDYLAFYGRGISRDILGKSGAMDDLTECLRIRNDFVSAWYDRGVIQTTDGNLEAAIADYTQAVELDPDFIQAYVTRGDLFAVLGKYEAAMADFDKAIELDPENPDPYYYRAMAWSEQGNKKKAQKDFETARQLGFDEDEEE